MFSCQHHIDGTNGGCNVASSPPLGSDNWVTQAVIGQWRDKWADTMSVADREFMGLAGKLIMVGIMDEGQAQDAIIRYVASSWLSYFMRTVPSVVLIALEDYDTAVGRLIMNSKGGRGEITPWIKAFSQLPLR